MCECVWGNLIKSYKILSHVASFFPLVRVRFLMIFERDLVSVYDCMVRDTAEFWLALCRAAAANARARVTSTAAAVVKPVIAFKRCSLILLGRCDGVVVDTRNVDARTTTATPSRQLRSPSAFHS